MQTFAVGDERNNKRDDDKFSKETSSPQRSFTLCTETCEQAALIICRTMMPPAAKGTPESVAANWATLSVDPMAAVAMRE